MIYDCIIIGKGPAGISAGLYVKRANRKVLVIGKDGGALEKTKQIQNYYGFPNGISGKELLENGLQQAESLGIETVTDEVIGVSFDGVYQVKTRNQNFSATTLILATGTSRNIPKIKGIKEFEGKGVSYCAVCDAFFYRNKEVTVIGSGDYAFAEAEELRPIVKSVTILTNGEVPVENRSNKIEIKEEKITEIRGEEGVREIAFENGEIISIDGVFVAIGTASSTDLAKKIGAVINNNQIVVNEEMQTNVPGLYACGDCTGGLFQITKAVYEGTKAGLSVIQYLRNG